MSKDMAVEGKTLEVFWRPGCPYCASLRRQLRRRGIDATWFNIWQDEQAAWFVRRFNNGEETVPTVRVGTQTLTNPTAEHVAQLVRGTPATIGAAAAVGRLEWLGGWLCGRPLR